MFSLRVIITAPLCSAESPSLLGHHTVNWVMQDYLITKYCSPCWNVLLCDLSSTHQSCWMKTQVIVAMDLSQKLENRSGAAVWWCPPTVCDALHCHCTEAYSATESCREMNVSLLHLSDKAAIEPGASLWKRFLLPEGHFFVWRWL